MVTGANRQRGGVRGQQVEQNVPAQRVKFAGATDDAQVRAFDGLFGFFQNVSNKLSGLADRAAKKQGELEGVRAGLDPEFRPTNQPTIRGQAFDTAGLRTFELQLDTRIRQAAEKAFDGNKDNPAGVQAEFAEIRKQFGADLPEQVRPGATALISRLELQFQRSAARNHNALVRDRLAASHAENLSTKLRTLTHAAFNLGLDGEADKVLAGEIDQLRQDLSTAGPNGRPLISATRAGTLLRNTQQQVATQRVLGAFSRLPSPGARVEFLKDLEKQFREDKGIAKDLDVDRFQGITAKLNAEIRRDEVKAAKVVNQVNQDIKGIRRIVEKGIVPTDQEISTIRGRVETSGDPELRQKMAQFENLADLASQARIARPQELQAAVEREQGNLARSGANEFQVARLEMSKNLLQEMRTSLDKDPLGWASRVGLVEIEPLDTTNTATFGASLKQRVSTAETVADYYRRKRVYLQPAERRALVSGIEAGQINVVQFSGELTGAIGGRAARTILGELGKDAPVIAHIGGLVSAGGSEIAARDAAEGLRQSRLEGFKPVKPKNADVANEVRSEYGRAFQLLPATQSTAVQAATLIFEKRARESNLDPDGREARKLMRRALQEAAGARNVEGVQTGGIVRHQGRRLVVPTNIKADQFSNLISFIRDQDLAALRTPPTFGNGEPVPAQRIRAATLISVGDGRYRVALGEPDGDRPRYILEKTGAFWILDLARLEEPLRARVPGAYSSDR